MMVLCLLTAIGTGAAMPLMFLVLGQLVDQFTNYFTPGSTLSRDAFMDEVINGT